MSLSRRTSTMFTSVAALAVLLSLAVTPAPAYAAYGPVGAYAESYNYGYCDRGSQFVTITSVYAGGTWVKMQVWRSPSCGTYWAYAYAPYDSSVHLIPSVWHPGAASQQDYLGIRETPMDAVGAAGSEKCWGTHMYRNGRWVAWVFEGCRKF